MSGALEPFKDNKLGLHSLTAKSLTVLSDSMTSLTVEVVSGDNLYNLTPCRHSEQNYNCSNIV